MYRAAFILLTGAVLVAGPSADAASQRSLLWRVVQTCMVNHTLTGAAFPCLAVETSSGTDSGYAVLRAPLEDTHIIVTPTVRTIGIEADRLRQPDAPDYFRDAWAARHFVTDGLAKAPRRSDLGLAVNSRLGRSQDQLHIHVDCVRGDVKASLQRQAATIHPHSWTRISVLPQVPHYLATAIESPDLAHVNPFALAAAGLKIDPDDMDDATIVITGTDSINGTPGFFLLARMRRQDNGDMAHGEGLLDHGCPDFH